VIAFGALPFPALERIQSAGLFAGRANKSKDHEKAFSKTKARGALQQLTG
jgi:hypothetical protein